MLKSYHLEGGNFSEAGNASSDIKKLLKRLGIQTKIIKKVAVAMYEAEINVVAHAYSGDINVTVATDHIRILVSDRGPGIPDIDQAMTEGFSTASDKVREMGFGAGMGLPNIKKNVDDLKIRTDVGKGTDLSMRIDLQ